MADTTTRTTLTTDTPSQHKNNETQIVFGTVYEIKSFRKTALQSISTTDSSEVSIYVSNDNANFVLKDTLNGNEFVGLYPYSYLKCVLVSGTPTVIMTNNR